MGNSGPETGRERLNRYLARCGVGSRRRADEIIAAGRVALNGVTVDKLATTVDPAVDTVTVDGRPVARTSPDNVWILFHKPAGTLTTRRDVRGRPTIFDRLPPIFAQLIPVGRLDQDTEGVLLLTSDGDGANRLMHPRYEIERIYEAEVQGIPAPSALAQLRQGIDLGDRTLAHADAAVTGKHPHGAVVRLVLREGRKREVKRMMQAIGHRVMRLRRVSFAGLTVHGMQPGDWRRLTEQEVARLLD
ncbi:MAG TPA: pseudouridine synthase [bacterium]|nr:pseudouridine synthase [bacterium]